MIGLTLFVGVVIANYMENKVRPCLCYHYHYVLLVTCYRCVDGCGVAVGLPRSLRCDLELQSESFQ